MCGLQLRFWALHSGVRLGNKQEARSRLRGAPDATEPREESHRAAPCRLGSPKRDLFPPSWYVIGFKHKRLSEKK